MKTVTVGIDVTSFNKGKMFVVKTAGGELLISYDKKVAYRNKSGKVYVDPRYYAYSATTLHHVGAFLGGGQKQIEDAIKNGEYEAAYLEVA
jgi:hypothetical protein